MVWGYGTNQWLALVTVGNSLLVFAKKLIHSQHLKNDRVSGS